MQIFWVSALSALGNPESKGVFRSPGALVGVSGVLSLSFFRLKNHCNMCTHLCVKFMYIKREMRLFGYYSSHQIRCLGLTSVNVSVPVAGATFNDKAAVVESKTGASFPTLLGETRRLLGIGLRKKCVLGLKNIDVYAFGVYADEANIKNMFNEKYGKLSVSELKGNKQFYEDVIDNDISMTVRLQIVYGRLSIGSVRSAFEESIGSRLQKFGGAHNKELLQRFTSMFKDEYKIPRGSVIELSREPKHVLRTTINGKEIGSIQSKLLCRSVLDLYIGEDPFDKRAKEDVEANLASLSR
ncbi:hypothetical protein Sjap_007899 [Stephania japonica]|uniref:Chalcone isomerase domain-containing protein n=1 Tax=Stephania japonica TaxID=461633 RepID=A0AAP0PE36_9MAGN